MNRFGRPRFRGAAGQKPFNARPASNNFGTPNLRQPGGPQHNSYQDNKSKEWQPSPSGSLLGAPPKRPYDDGNNSSRASGGNQSFQQNNPPVPSEVRKLMQTLGLSQGDIQKLSQLPEKELSANNLARAIGDLRQGKGGNDGRSQSFNSSSTSTPNRSSSFRREERDSFGGDGILGERPGARIRYPPFRSDDYHFDKHSDQDRSRFDSDDRHKNPGMKNSDRFSEQQYDRNEYMDSKPGSRFDDRRQFSRGDRDDDYYDDSPSYRRGGSGDRYDQASDDSFSQSNRRFSNKNINQREAESRQGYGGGRRMDRGGPDLQDLPPRGSLPRPVGTRNSSRPLMRRSPRREDGLMGDPMRPGGQGLENLVAAVGGGSASLLTPLMLATQTDPSVLEAQIRAMKALQAQAIKMKEQQSYSRPGRDQRRDHTPPRRRSPPPRSRASLIDRHLEEEARKEAQVMRTARGRVVYIKFKSPRIIEDDLRLLARPFGKVTKLLLIKPKIPNGHFQVFMELDQWDCAAAMLEHYMAKPPNIKGCPVDVKRSNYVDLKLRHEQNRNKRLRSISPIREGTTQLSYKRDRLDDAGKLSITTGKSDRRVVTHSNDGADSGEKNTDGSGKEDAREILNRSRSLDKKEGEPKVRSRTRWGSVTPSGKSGEELGDKESDKDKDENDPEKKGEGQESTREKTDLSENVASKEELDPLDEIADELALHDEFVLMDEADKREKKTDKDEVKPGDADIEEEEKAEAATDLDKTDLDLDDVNVDEQPTEEPVEEQIHEDDQVAEGSEERMEQQTEPTTAETEESKSVYIAKEENAEDVSEEGQTKCSEDAVVSETDNFSRNEEPSQQEEEKMNEDYEETAQSMDNTKQEESEPANVSTGLMDAIDEFLEDSNDGHPYLREDQLETEESFRMDKIEHLQTLMEDSLKEVVSARRLLEALTKVTKAKAAQALAKKIDVCLEIASGFLRNPDAPVEEE